MYVLAIRGCRVEAEVPYAAEDGFHIKAEADGNGTTESPQLSGSGESNIITDEAASDSIDINEHPHYDTSRPHLCTVCDKGFKTKGDLARHKMIHTAEKPFQCTVCNLSLIHI